MIHNEKGFNLAQIVVGVMVALIIGTVVGLNIIGYIEDARLAASIQRAEELQNERLLGNDVKGEVVELDILKKDVQQVLGYHQAQGTKLNGLVFENKAVDSEGKLHVGKLSMENTEESFELQGVEIQEIKSVVGDVYRVQKDNVGGVEEVEASGNTDLFGACGYMTYVKSENVLYMWGRNDRGQLGLGDEQDWLNPVKTDLDASSVKEVDCGLYHSLYRDGNGVVYSSGENESGQLGDGTSGSRSQFGKVTWLSDIVKMDTLFYHTLALDKDGVLYAWGKNNYGQVGLGHKINEGYPREVDIEGKVVDMATGAYHSLAVTDQGDVFSWGSNQYGQLGNGATYGTQTTPQKVNYEFDSKVVNVYAGSHSSYVLTEKGELYAWGINGRGQLGLGDANNRHFPEKVDVTGNVEKVITGYRSVIVKTGSGDMYGWGMNSNGELALGFSSTSVKSPRKISGLGEVKGLEGGFHHFMMKTEEGDTYVWGYNYKGILGDGTQTSSDEPMLLELKEE